MGGATTILWNLLYHIVQIDPTIQIHVFLLPSEEHKYSDLPVGTQIQFREVKRAETSIGRILWQQWRLPIICLREKPHILMTLTNIGAICPTVPQVVYYHQALLFDDDRTTLYPQTLKQRIFKQLAIWGMRSSSLVITQTNTMRQAILSQTCLPQHSLITIYPGIPIEHKTTQADAAWQIVLDSLLSLKRPSLLYLSHPVPHKNFKVLLQATAELKRRGENTITVLTLDRNHPDPYYAMLVKQYEQMIVELDIADYVYWAGMLPRQAIVPFIRQTDLFVFPSLIESFPQPLVEAMPHGAVMLLADKPYAREIAGESAQYFNPYDLIDLAEKASQLLRDEGLRKKLAERARLQSNLFSYEKGTKEILFHLREYIYY
jgi:glycosyltransferase involved in cell wall biosynthesis